MERKSDEQQSNFKAVSDKILNSFDKIATCSFTFCRVSDFVSNSFDRNFFKIRIDLTDQEKINENFNKIIEIAKIAIDEFEDTNSNPDSKFFWSLFYKNNR